MLAYLIKTLFPENLHKRTTAEATATTTKTATTTTPTPTTTRQTTAKH